MNAPIKSEAELSREIQALNADLKKEALVKVAIPKAFEKITGGTLFVSHNFSSIVLPVDGKAYDVPESMASIVNEWISKQEI